jgi:hypothetical protein
VIYNKHLEWRMLPMVIDYCSIRSFSVKTLQPDLTAFFILSSLKMPLRSSHQQHVFIYKKVVLYTTVDCLPNCSPLAHTPGVTCSLDSRSHLVQYQWVGMQTLVFQCGVGWWPFAAKAELKQGPYIVKTTFLITLLQRKLIKRKDVVASPCL